MAGQRALCTNLNAATGAVLVMFGLRLALEQRPV